MFARIPTSFCLLLAFACAPAARAADAPPPAVPAEAQGAVEHAESLHLQRRYPEALAAYGQIIAKHPGWLRPHYLRWILQVDMGDLQALEKELGFVAGTPFEAMLDGAVARCPKELAAAKDNPRPWLHQVARRYAEAKAMTPAAGPAREESVKTVLRTRDLPMDLREKLEDTLPEIDRAEAAHLSHRYATALVRYDKIIAKNPAALRPHYLRWILMVDMGALSILNRELGLDADLPFGQSLEAAEAHLPPSLQGGPEDPRPWLQKVALRYYEIKPTHVANRGDMDLAVRLARRALEAPDLPKQLEYELRENLVVYLGDTNRFADTVAAADALEKQYGEPAIGVLSRKAAALESLGRHAESIATCRRILERLEAAGAPFADLLPHLRAQYTAWRNAGDLKQARSLLRTIGEHTALPQPARKGCAPDWGGDYAWLQLQEVRLLMQENNLPEAEVKLAAMEKDFAGSPEVVFLRATLEHLCGRSRKALGFYRRLEAEDATPNPLTLAGRMAAQSDAGHATDKQAVRAELARWQKTLPESPELAALAARFATEDGPGGARKTAGPQPEKIWTADLPWNDGEVLTLCYHDIPDEVPRGDTYGVDVETFISHLELLKARGFHFIRLSDVVAARKGQKKLPPKSVLLTFDDGYKTHHDNLLPILELYQSPAVLAVVTQWLGHGKGVDAPGSDLCQFAPFMSAEDLREAAAHPLVEIACHSHDLHHAVPMNPFGNTAPAALARQWLASGAYESDDAYADRIASDLRDNARRIRDITGRPPAGVAWPFGAHNAETNAIARAQGLNVLMDLGDGTYRPEDYPGMPRFLVFHSMRQIDLAQQIAAHAHNAPPMRGEYLSLDGLIGHDDETTAKNLDRAVAELSRKRPSHVMLDVSSPALGPCFPTGYPAAAGHSGKIRDWASHIARALEIHDMFVILRVCERDRKHLAAILKLPVGNDIFLDYAATAAEVAQADGMRTEGHVLVRLGGPGNADLFVCSDSEGFRPSGANLDNLVFWCQGEPGIAKAAADGARHWIGMSDNRFNTTRSFMARPPADPHWLMMPPATRRDH